MTAHDGTDGKTTRSLYRVMLPVAVTLLMIALAVVHMFNLKVCGKSLTFDVPLLGLILAAVLPWISAGLPRFIRRVRSFKALGVEVELELRRELSMHSQAIAKQSDVISQQQQMLNKLIVFSMESDIFDTLENLLDQPSFTFNKKWKLLVKQFEHLFQRGFLNTDPADLKDGEEVGNGRLVTPLGRYYIDQRRRMQPEEVGPPAQVS